MLQLILYDPDVAAAAAAAAAAASEGEGIGASRLVEPVLLQSIYPSQKFTICIFGRNIHFRWLKSILIKFLG